MSLKKNISILMAGGGTGGHLFPGISLAKDFQKRNRDIKISFLVPGTPVDLLILSSTYFPFTVNPMRSFPAKYIQYPDFFCRFFFGWHKTFHAFRRYKPDIVVGLGGYGAFSAGIVAQKYGIPLVMLEANRIAGKVVRCLAKGCERIYTQGEIQGISTEKVKALGIPVRFEYSQEEKKSNLKKEEKTILVIGGSLGAKCINESLIHSLPFLMEVKDRVRFLHICGKDTELVEKQYQKYGMRCQVFPFYHNMEELYRMSDFVVARAGGSSLAEITYMGLPSILVPFARSADGHQEANAMYMEKANASMVIREMELTGELLASKIVEMVLNQEKISMMSQASRLQGKPFAARDIVLDIYELLEKKRSTLTSCQVCNKG